MAKDKRTARNPFTGDEIKTKPATDKYRTGWDLIWGDKQKKDKK